MTSDPVGTDLRLANRRIDEYVAVSRDETRRARVLSGYRELLVRFQTEDDEQEKERIMEALRSQQDNLRKVGLSTRNWMVTFREVPPKQVATFQSPKIP